MHREKNPTVGLTSPFTLKNTPCSAKQSPDKKNNEPKKLKSAQLKMNKKMSTNVPISTGMFGVHIN